VVATRKIEKGKVVLVDHASILAVVEYPADVMREEVQELLRVAAAQLRDPERVEGLARQGVREEDEDGIGKSIMEDVLLTNSFGVVVGGKEYMALFADLAVSERHHIMSQRLLSDVAGSRANTLAEVQSCLQPKVSRWKRSHFACPSDFFTAHSSTFRRPHLR
jgi:hypothetical protein